MPLMGRRSTRAAISPGMTRVVPEVAVPDPEVSCAITVLLAAIRFGDGRVKRKLWRLATTVKVPVSRPTFRSARGLPSGFQRRQQPRIGVGVVALAVVGDG
jgi:hypothetical protein